MTRCFPALRYAPSGYGWHILRRKCPMLDQMHLKSTSKNSDIKARIVEDFGHDVEVLVLPVKEFNVVASFNPFLPRGGADEKLFHGTFLFQPVSKTDFRKLKLPAPPGEQAVLIGQVVLLHCPHGYGRTKLNNDFLEKVLKVSATTRNWRTILALQALCAQQTATA